MTGTQTLIAILAIAAAIEHRRRQLDEKKKRFELLVGVISSGHSKDL